MQVSAEYPDGSSRLVEAHERLIPLIGTPETIRVLEPIENDDWTFVFQVDRSLPEGGLFRAIPLLDQNTFAFL
ncbi:MAG TPA: hypothetical protein VNZ43_12960 [Sphingomonadaceae bacterium]|jgi:hypothetical protein|nr:hypothetical protein [Sphingomonadaceae bacterium]